MAYGTVKVDNITFDNGGSDQNVTVSGLYNSLTSGITVTGTISGAVVIGSTSVSGTTVAGVTVTGTTVQGASGTFTSLTGTTIQGTTATFTSGIIASGTAAAPSLAILGDPDTGVFSPGADQLAVATNGTGRLFVDASGNVQIAGNLQTGVSATTGQQQIRFNTQNTYAGQIYTDNLENLWLLGGAIYDGTNFVANTGTTAAMMRIVQGAIRFETNSSLTPSGNFTPQERLRITSAGLVGIGTSAPGKLLEVSSSTDATIRINDPATVGTVDRYIGGVEYYTNDSSGGAKVACSIKGYHVDLSGKGRLQFATGNETTAMTINGSQQVGIGTTSPSEVLNVVGNILATGRVRSKNGTIGDVGLGFTDDHNVGLYRPESDTLGFVTSSSERARIDSSGRLLVGTSSARSNFFNTIVAAQFQIEGTGVDSFASQIRNGENPNCAVHILAKSRGAAVGSNTIVQSADQLGQISFQGSDGTEFVEGALIRGEVDGTPGANDMPGRLVFSTTADGASTPTERMRIGQSGYMKLSNNGSYLGTAATYHEINGNAGSGSLALSVANTSATGNGVQINSSSDGTSYVYLIGYSTSVAAARIIIWSNGNVVNNNNSYGAISDIKLKENIVDANSQWDDLKALQVRNYNFKEGQIHTQIGLVAQEVELVSPGLVTESPDRDEDGNDLGTVTKSVSYSVLYMKAVKALQEAMERIESLEQRLNDAGIN